MKNIFLVFIVAVTVIAGCKNEKNEKNDKSTTKEVPSYVNDMIQQVKKNPDSTGLRLKLVDALDSLDQFEEAVIQMDSLIKKDSLNYGLWYRKGRLLENAEDTVAAIAAYTKAIKIYPAPDGLLSLANLLAETKNSNALLLCQRVAELRLGREYSANCYFISGVYFARTGNKAKAIKAFDNCINENFSYMEAYQEKGFIFYDDKKYNQALKIFQMAATVNNTYADAYYWQAKCYEALHKKEEAIKNYQTALVLDSTLKEAGEAIKRLEN